MTSYWCERAWLPDGLAERVLVRVGGRPGLVRVHCDAIPPGARRLHGVVLPGFANAHSHAFHRALRGRTHDGGGTFWTWRERMYALAAKLDPDGYLALARAVYAEMALAGVTCVGEFHYLHHARRLQRDGVTRCAQAAAEAGIRLTLLDTCYLRGRHRHQPLNEVQRRFSDGNAEAWASRVAELRGRRRDAGWRGDPLRARRAARRAFRGRVGVPGPAAARAPVRAARRERGVRAPRTGSPRPELLPRPVRCRRGPRPCTPPI